MKFNRFHKKRLNLFVLLLFRASSWWLQGHPFCMQKFLHKGCFVPLVLVLFAQVLLGG